MYPVEKNNSWYFTQWGQVYFPFSKLYERHEYCFDMLHGDPNYADGIYAFLCLFDGSEEIDESAERCVYFVFSINFKNRLIEFILIDHQR